MKQWPLLLMMCLLGGCSSAWKIGEDSTPPQIAGYAALYDLTSRNADVGKLLIFKSVDPPVKQAIDDFAKLCADAAKQIRQFAADDDDIDLKTGWLTEIEKQARAGIESDTSTALLTGFGKDFQTHLLASESDAAQYGSKLAAAVAKLEEDPARKKYLTDLSADLDKMYQRLFKLLIPPAPSPQSQP